MHKVGDKVILSSSKNPQQDIFHYYGTIVDLDDYYTHVRLDRQPENGIHTIGKVYLYAVDDYCIFPIIDPNDILKEML